MHSEFQCVHTLRFFATNMERLCNQSLTVFAQCGSVASNSQSQTHFLATLTIPVRRTLEKWMHPRSLHQLMLIRVVRRCRVQTCRQRYHQRYLTFMRAWERKHTRLQQLATHRLTKLEKHIVSAVSGRCLPHLSGTVGRNIAVRTKSRSQIAARVAPTCAKLIMKKSVMWQHMAISWCK